MKDAYQKDWMARWAIYQPEKVAVKELESGRSLTYGQLNRLGNALAYRLEKDFGLQKGDRIAILAENRLEYVLLFSAAQKGGFILVPMNYRLAPAEVAYLVERSAPRMIITERQFEPLLSEVDKAEGPRQLSMESLKDWWKMALKAPEVAYQPQQLENDHPIFILFTSGTTGFPKGAIYTHKMLLWNSLNTLMRLELTQNDRTIMCMPPFHTGGWNVLLTPFLHLGACTCLMKKFDAERVMEGLVKEKATLFMGVPTMLKMMADAPNFASTELPELRYFIVGGEPMPVPLIEQWAEKGIPVRQGYGMTEVGPNLFSLHQDDALRKKGSIGQPNFYVETKIVDEAGGETGPNEPGELLLRGPMTMPGYWQNEEATEKAFSDGWFKTGDLLVKDEEGYFFVVDRIKHMFISGGENVYPAEVERVLVQHPDIEEAAVIGVADPKWGEVGKALLVLAEGKSLELEALKAFCQGKLARFKIPKHLEIRQELPKNATGKIDRKQLMNDRMIE
jgi:fatty-acyl-CoA synthase